MLRARAGYQLPPLAAAGCPGDAGRSGTAVPLLEPETERNDATDDQEQTESEWFVILHDDDDHTYAYVILLLVTLCRMSVIEALQHAEEVDADGVTIVACRPREEAENLAHQIMRFGGDPFLRTSCSMRASIEPVAG
jgi:ATP-dependent Clp protease adaptor protein ClpS